MCILRLARFSQMDVDDLHPCPRSAEEDAPVSVFLDSFSAFGMTTADTVQGIEVTPDSQPMRQEHAPDKPTHRAEATASTEAAYELSAPLAQVTCVCVVVGTRLRLTCFASCTYYCCRLAARVLLMLLLLLVLPPRSLFRVQ